MEPIMVLYGPEDYTADFYREKALAEIPEGVRDFAVSRSEVSSFGEESYSLAVALPMLSEKRAVFLTVPDFKGLDTDEFREYLENPSPSTILVIRVREEHPNRNRKIFKALSKKGYLKSCEKLKTEQDFMKVILHEVKRQGGSITPAALREFTDRVNYLGMDDMTLLMAVSYLNVVLMAGGGAVTPELVAEYVPRQQKADVWSYAKLLNAGDMKALYEQALLVQPKDTIGAASALLYDLRLSYKESVFGSYKAVGGYRQPAFSGTDRSTLVEMIRVVTEKIAAIKSGTLQSERLLQEIFNSLIIVLRESKKEAEGK